MNTKINVDVKQKSLLKKFSQENIELEAQNKSFLVQCQKWPKLVKKGPNCIVKLLKSF